MNIGLLIIGTLNHTTKKYKLYSDIVLKVYHNRPIQYI